MLFRDVTKLIGNTPLIRLKFKELPPHVELWGKLEGQNPAGSVKDRPAYNMLKCALENGTISGDSKLVEATSGNTGIALAMVGASLGLDLTLVMPENSTPERVATMKAFGAKVILTPADRTIEYSRKCAERMVREEGYVMMDQFNNKDNYLAHYKSTGPEIWKDTNEKVTHFIATMGTTGTIMGSSMYLKEKNKNVQIVGVQPEEGSRIPGIRKWSPEFLPGIYDPQRVDRIIYVSEDKAKNMSKRLAEEQGVFVGFSSGGSVSAALHIAQELKDPALLVCILCDRGDRYLSSGFFD